jgi:hypothetical protein
MPLAGDEHNFCRKSFLIKNWRPEQDRFHKTGACIINLFTGLTLKASVFVRVNKKLLIITKTLT